ncbi:MAG: hypothetical protein ACM3H8_14090 [Sphingobacteriales bacterium]
MKRYLLAFILLVTTLSALPCDCSIMKFEEKVNKSSLIFSGTLIWHNTAGDMPDSMLFVASDVWKGRYFKGDTIFILNDLNGCGIMNVQDEEDYLIYSWANMIVPCSGSRPLWSTTETEKLDDTFKWGPDSTVTINNVPFTSREAYRIRIIFNSSDITISDSLNPLYPSIMFNEKMISLKVFSQMDFSGPLRVTKFETAKRKTKSKEPAAVKEIFYAKLEKKDAKKKNDLDKAKRMMSKLIQNISDSNKKN